MQINDSNKFILVLKIINTTIYFSIKRYLVIFRNVFKRKGYYIRHYFITITIHDQFPKCKIMLW